MSDRLKEENRVRRLFFSDNVSDLTSRVLRLNRQDAATALGVDYGWLRKCCSVGLTRPNRRNADQIQKLADRFHLPVDDLWTPRLLIRVWAGGYLPEVRDYWVSEFKFDDYAKSSESLRAEIEDGLDLGIIEQQRTKPSDGREDRGPDDTEDRISTTCRRLRELLLTGRYDYLHSLIGDLDARAHDDAKDG